MTKDEALKLALEALENMSAALREEDVLGSDSELMLNAAAAIRVALAQPERPWAGLTGQEKELIASVSLDVHDAVHRTDAKLKEKNT